MMMADSANSPLVAASATGPAPAPDRATSPAAPNTGDNGNENHNTTPAQARPSPSIPVTLREAALDSPAFRATALHFADQVDSVERWLDSYVRAASRLAHDVQALEDPVNSFLGKITPNQSPAEALIDHDYTTLALRRFGEASRDWWIQILATVRRTEAIMADPLRNFLNNDLRAFLSTRRNLDQAQKTFDTTLARYVAQSKTKEPSALREDAFAVFETRKAYLKASMEFCILASQLRYTLDKLLVRLSSDMFREMRRARDSFSAGASASASLEMERVRGWSKDMEASESIFRRELLMARRDIAEATLSSFKPSRELDDYSTSTVPFLGNRGPTNVVQKDATAAISEKQGWLFLKTVSGKPVRTSWVRRWYYCRDGVFGWLVQGPQGVLQGEEIGVLLCNAKPAVQEERRFCFEVKTKIQNILLQAETQAQLIEWLEVFEVAKKRAFEASLSHDSGTLPGGADPAFSITPPSIPEFSARLLEAPGGSEDLSSGFDRAGTLPVPAPDAALASRSSFDVNNTLPRRALTNLAREEGETGREHAARIMQKLDLHRKTTFSASGDLAAMASPAHLSQSASGGQLSLPYSGLSGHGRGQMPLPSLSMIDGFQGMLAPLTLSKVPLPTSLSRAVVSVSGERGYGTEPSKGIPTALLANYWGSNPWGNAYVSSESSRDTGSSAAESMPQEPQLGELLLAENESKSASVAGHKKTQSADTRITIQPPVEKHGGEIFPPNYPYELRAHHAQFRVLFPGVPVHEKLVLVFRASWSSTSYDAAAPQTAADQGLTGTGRVYVTPDNMYFYGHQMGLVVAYATRLDTISEVTAAPGKECDFIFLHLNEEPPDSGYSRITIKTFLEDLELLHARLNLLVDDLQAEEPMEVPELVHSLANMGRESPGRKSPSEESWEEVSANTPVDNGTPGGRPVLPRPRDGSNMQARSLYRGGLRKPTPKFQLPTRPILFEPEDMQRKVSERHFEISAKACFHVLFGDKSFVFPKLYFERRAQQIAQGPWVLADHGKMKREFRFKAESVDIIGRSRSADVVDFQTVDVFSDHVTYLVTHVKTPWHLPHSQYFKLVTKVVITHLAKSKCKLAVFTKVDWSKTPAFSKNMVERQALADAGRDAEELADVATDQVRKLGPHSRTKRAIQVYGHVGQQAQVVLFKPGQTTETANRKHAIKPRTLTTMAFETVRSFAESVASSLVMWAFAGLRTLFKVATAHRLILILLATSTMTNVMFTSKDSSRWWSERNAAKFMSRVGVGPNAMMSKAIYLSDLEEATLRSNATGGPTSEGSCSSTFRAISSAADLDCPFEETDISLSSARSRAAARRLRHTRQKLGLYRHDLVVAMRVVNNIEREMVQSEWENWLADENVRCEQAKGLLYQEDGPEGGAARAHHTAQAGYEEDKFEGLKKWHREYCGSCRQEQKALLSLKERWD
ncbi:putative PH domain-containing protein C19A8.02 [Zalerion maritima]|uniref:PH domain-containing protein C19A8.02 n=1 Tax=Zalerion maritima TaxID=339359 RepID=A0AAD5RUS4_9PEZI|nr:putative PH domain-containing protein C19A8.02 [Zalerion maritima]